ncbi:hypothetical protein VQH23_04040 [Pararoseomonas sp. SCSIO 73927]|uniref:hypothetical protein n=1 Tax=Pararoseomonas sp. SCSIO 73927 TaxID=3114537 RepID=UPI0030D2B7B6
MDDQEPRLILERRGRVSMQWWWLVMLAGQTLASSNQSFKSSEDAFEAGLPELERLTIEAAK